MSSVSVCAVVPCAADLLQGHKGQYLAANVEKFKDLLGRIVSRFPSQEAFAKAMGMNSSRLSRAIKKADFPFNVENCLRLAKVSGESASEILRAADKADVAALIESLYGKDRSRLLSTAERELLDRVANMTDEDLELLTRLLDRFFQHQVEPRTKRKTS